MTRATARAKSVEGAESPAPPVGMGVDVGSKTVGAGVGPDVGPDVGSDVGPGVGCDVGPGVGCEVGPGVGLTVSLHPRVGKTQPQAPVKIS
jgi:hypothetical protein